MENGKADAIQENGDPEGGGSTAKTQRGEAKLIHLFYITIATVVAVH
jgi:hypothetical protein